MQIARQIYRLAKGNKELHCDADQLKENKCQDSYFFRSRSVIFPLPRMKRANYGKAISHGFAFFSFLLFSGKARFCRSTSRVFWNRYRFFLSLFSYPSFPIGTPPPSSASKFEKREKKSPAVLHPLLGIFAALKNIPIKNKTPLETKKRETKMLGTKNSGPSFRDSLTN